MALPKGIEALPITQWTNRHENITVSLTHGNSFDMKPSADDINDNVGNYHGATRNFQWLIQNAIDKNTTLRAMGAGWSFNDVAVSDGIVDTREVRAFFSIGNDFLHTEYLLAGNTASNLIFTQCGMSIYQLNRELETENNWNSCLKASGASDGQTVAGATATGTHGSAFNVGAVHDAVIGLHLIVGPDRHVWLEKASRKVASDKFIQWLGAERISNDDAFNSAVVSFGSFGFINGMLFETEPKFLLKKYTTGKIAFDAAIQKAVTDLDFSGIAAHFPQQSTMDDLYHFEVIINPHEFEPDNQEKGVYLKAMFKTPYRNDYVRTKPSAKFEYGDDLLGVIETLLDQLGPVLQDLLIPKMVNKLLPLAYVSGDVSEGTIGETFTNTKIRGKAASAAIGIDISNSCRAVTEIVAINKIRPFAGALALRFVKGTDATLGFTKFPVTCVLEMDGVDSKGSREFFELIWDKFEQVGIDYTLHWGKINFNLNASRVNSMYGTHKVAIWKKWRRELLGPEGCKVFTNDFMKRCGLDVVDEAIV